MMRLFKGLVLIVIISGCHLFTKDPLFAAHDLAAKGKKQEALTALKEGMDNETNEEKILKMAKYGAQLAHLEIRDYHSAVFFYKHLANYGKSPDEQLSALRYMGPIYFDHLKDFELAVSVFESILRYPLSVEEKARYRLMLGKSHYNLAQLDQAEAELQSFRELTPSKSLIYEGDVFETNILVSKKEHEKAAEILKRLLSEFPERAQSDGLEMNLVACYEDMKDFDKAIEAMEEMKKVYADPEFLEMRIARLRERKNNMPGARGLRK